MHVDKKKDLNKLSIEELGHLFPIFIADYNPDWPELFFPEKDNIIKTVGPEFISRIEHIGSTSVPGLSAKPTIDILLEIPDFTDCDVLIENLQKIKYQYIPCPDKPPPNMMFAKGYTPDGISGQTFHIHVRYPGDWDEIIFRDYLIDNPETALEYAELKKRLATEFRHNREEYTEHKTAFIKHYTQLARSVRKSYDCRFPGTS